MADDGKIYIIITDKLPAGTSSPGAPGMATTPSGAAATGTKNNIIMDYAAHEFFNLIKKEVGVVINYNLNNIGNFTGDYITQRHINETRTILSDITSLGIAAVAGAKFGGVPGAIIATVVQATGLVTSAVVNYNLNQVQNTKVNYEIDQLKDRSGLNTLRDGSRGTLN